MDQTSPENTSPKPRRWWAELEGIVFLLLVWLYFCRRILASLYDQLYVWAGIDTIGELWMSWWAQKAIASPDLSLFHCSFLNFPLGTEAFTWDVAFLHMLLAGLLRGAVGAFGSLNLLFVLSLLFSMFGAYVLIRQFSDSRLFAVLLSILPLQASRGAYGPPFDDIGLANLGFLTLTCALWIRLLRQRNTKLVLATGLLVGLTFATQMYYGVSVGLLMGLAMIAALFKLGPESRPVRQIWLFTIPALIIGAVLSLPVLLEPASFLADVSWFQKLPWFVRIKPGEMTGAPPLSSLWPLLPLAAVAWFSFRRQRQAWFWFVAAAFFFVLALGPHARLTASSTLLLPMPTILLKNLLPLMWRLSEPVRFGRMAVVAMVVLLALAERLLAERHDWGWTKRLRAMAVLFWLGSLLAPTFMLFSPHWLPELTPIMPTQPPQTPAAYRQMAAEKDDYVVVDFSCTEDVEETKWHAFYQTVHGKPIVGLPLRPPSYAEGQKPSPLTIAQRELDRALAAGTESVFPEAAWWRESKVGALALHKYCLDRMSPEVISAWDEQYGEPVFAGENVRLYRLLPQ